MTKEKQKISGLIEYKKLLTEKACENIWNNYVLDFSTHCNCMEISHKSNRSDKCKCGFYYNCAVVLGRIKKNVKQNE